MPAEGTISFLLDFSPGPPPKADQVGELSAWHRILFLLRLTGQEPGRYGGMAFGNLSRRLVPSKATSEAGPFIITGTQTAGKLALSPSDYALVNTWDPIRNILSARGPLRPSSEALTHGSIYRSDAGVNVIFHVHSPEIWSRASSMGLPRTSGQAAQGSAELAREVGRLMAEGVVRAGGVLILGGHEDGVIAYGRTAEEAGTVLLKQLARAFQLSA